MLAKFKNNHLILMGINILAGSFYALGFPSFLNISIPFLPIIGVTLLFWSTLKSNQSETSLKKKAIIFLCFCFGYYFVGYYWIPYTIKEFGSIPFPFNHLLGLALPFIILPHIFIFIICDHFAYKKIHFLGPVCYHLLYAGIITLLEYYTPQQFPAHLGHPWPSFAPYLGLAPILGAPAFSFVSFWCALSLATYLTQKKYDLLPWIFLLIFCMANATAPLQKETDGDSKKFPIRIVQANVGNYMKVKAEQGVLNAMQEVVQYYESQSTAQDGFRPQLIIWPETAYPRVLRSEFAKKSPYFVPRPIRKIIEQMDSEIIFGGYDLVNKKPGDYFESEANTVFLVGTERLVKDVYHKVKLIPFGETLPLGPLTRFAAQYITNISYFASGKTQNTMSLGSGLRFIAPICYEILFSQFMLGFFDHSKPPHFIVNLTNDSWYGDTAEPHQHKFLAKWRALEFGIPIIRSTNTGITSVLFPDGSESESLSINTRGKLDTTLNLASNPTPTVFSRFGPLLTWLFWLLALTVCVATRASKWQGQLLIDRASAKGQ